MRLLLLIFFCAIAVPGWSQPVDLLVIAADDASLQPLLRRLEHGQQETHAAWSFWSGQLSGRSVVLVRSEGDPLNAVAATTLAIGRHRPRLILSYGSARAHDPGLHAGDLVVSEKFAAFDGIESRRREVGEGSVAGEWSVLPHLFLNPEGREEEMRFFPADPRALALARTLPNPGGRVLTGVLGSAGQHNREADRLAWLRARWGTSCEDGESAFIAGCALALGVPVVGLRVIEGRPDQAAAVAAEFVEGWR